MARRVYLLAFGLLFATADATFAQNLLVNPNFDSNVAGWSFTTPGTFTHDPSLDADGNPLSGSGRLDNTSPVAFGSSFAAHCVAVTGGSNYDFRAQIRIPSGQTQTGYAMVVANFYNGASCSGSNVGGTASPQVLSTTTDTWVLSQVLAFAAPAAAVSAQVNLWVNKTQANGSLVVNFDNVAFGLTGSIGPTPTPTATATSTATATATPTATATSTASPTPTSTSTPTGTATPTATIGPNLTPTATPTWTPVGIPTATPTVTPTWTPMATINPTAAAVAPIPATGHSGLLILLAFLALAGFLILRTR